MSRKTVPLLMTAVGALFLALVVIIVILLSTPQRRAAREMRIEAVRTLRNEVAAVEEDVAKPISPGGSLDDLYHFLSKDPGRSDFPRPADRRRADEYFPESADNLLGRYAGEAVSSGAAAWAAEYVAGTKFLFGEAKREILGMTGVPQGITAVLEVPSGAGPSAADRMESAVARFAEDWIPQGETAATYSSDRDLVKEELTGSRRFFDGLEGIDDSWRNLIASLYNLSMDPHWRIAVEYEPRLQVELDELTVLVIAADLHRRGRDLMAGVPPTDGGDAAGIVWIPEFSFYKNIPEVMGNTSDEVPTVFFAKVNLGYTFRDSRTQTWLNRRKDWLTDYVNAFFSDTSIDDFSPVDRDDRDSAEWDIARLKAEGLHGINERIVSSIPFGAKKVYGVRELALVRVNMIPNP